MEKTGTEHRGDSKKGLSFAQCCYGSQKEGTEGHNSPLFLLITGTTAVLFNKPFFS
jgi:hypothetical protein